MKTTSELTVMAYLVQAARELVAAQSFNNEAQCKAFIADNMDTIIARARELHFQAVSKLVFNPIPQIEKVRQLIATSVHTRIRNQYINQQALQRYNALFAQEQ